MSGPELMIASMLGSTVLGKAMAPKTPKVEDPKVAPVANEKQSQLAKERDNQRRFGQSGRIGTVMSDNNKLG